MSISEAPTLAGFAGVVCANVRAEASRKGWSQADLGRALGFTSNQISRRWRGAISWPLEELEDVAKALQIPLQRLLEVPRDELRARRDSNPQPSDLESDEVGLALAVLGLVAVARTAARR